MNDRPFFFSASVREMPAYHPFRILAVAILMALLVASGLQASTAAPTRQHGIERTQTNAKAKGTCKKNNPQKKCKKGTKGGKEGGGGGYAGYYSDEAVA